MSLLSYAKSIRACIIYIAIEIRKAASWFTMLNNAIIFYGKHGSPFSFFLRLWGLPYSRDIRDAFVINGRHWMLSRFGDIGNHIIIRMTLYLLVGIELEQIYRS